MLLDAEQASGYSLHPEPLLLPPPAAGYYIFRGANSQKNTFRKNPSDPSVAGELGLLGAVAQVGQQSFLGFPFALFSPRP